MNEIERAIEQLESLMYDAGHKGDIEDYNALKTAIAILRAELDREKNPLTCDGCSHDGKYLYSLMAGEKCPCTGCKRITKDRYEPKGEKE